MESLLMGKDFRDIIIDEIVNKARTTRITFYRHYTDKYALFNEIISLKIQNWIKESDFTNYQQNPASAFFNLAKSAKNYLNNNEYILKSSEVSDSFPFLLTIVTDEFSKQLTEAICPKKSKKTKIATELMIHNFCWTIANISYFQYKNQDKLSDAVLFKYLKEYFKMLS